MSLLFVDGFDHYQAPLQKWDSQILFGSPDGVPIILPTAGRNGGGCLQIMNRQNGNTQCQIVKNFTNLATVLVGFALNIDIGVTTSIDCPILQFMDGTSIQVDLRLNGSGHFYFTRNGTVLGSQSTNALSLRTWHYIEVKVTIDPSAGVCVLNVDGSNTGWLNLTAQNTRTSSNSQTGSIRLGYVFNGNFFAATYQGYLVDDLYIANTSGSFNNSFLGDVKVQGLMPSGNGTSTQYALNEATWSASTVEYVGHMIKDSNGNLQLVTAVASDALSGGSAPAWNVTTGGTTTDNHVTWRNLGAASACLEINQNPPEGSGCRLSEVAGYSLNTAYAIGTAVWDNNGNLQLCTTAGTTGASDPPTWNATPGGVTTDTGTLRWTNLGLGEDTYLSDATVGHLERFTFPAIVASAIAAVVVTMRARKDDASVRSIRGATLSGGTTGDSGTDLAMSTSYQMVQGILESDPNTSAAWTPSAVNAAEFGVKTTA